MSSFIDLENESKSYNWVHMSIFTIYKNENFKFEKEHVILSKINYKPKLKKNTN